jgi:hypothetical protein
VCVSLTRVVRTAQQQIYIYIYIYIYTCLAVAKFPKLAEKQAKQIMAAATGFLSRYFGIFFRFRLLSGVYRGTTCADPLCSALLAFSPAFESPGNCTSAFGEKSRPPI